VEIRRLGGDNATLAAKAKAYLERELASLLATQAKRNEMNDRKGNRSSAIDFGTAWERQQHRRCFLPCERMDAPAGVDAMKARRL
jgi:hypothetical protein